MPKDSNVQFHKLINEMFDSVIQGYGFEFHEESEDLIFAKKDDIDLIFRLEQTRLFYYFSLEIKLSGELGRRATSDSYYRYRGLGVSTIAKCLDQDYKIFSKAAQTEDELRDILEVNKNDLLKYCENILLGDVSIWQKVVDCLIAQKNSG